MAWFLFSLSHDFPVKKITKYTSSCECVFTVDWTLGTASNLNFGDQIIITSFACSTHCTGICDIFA